MNILFKKQNLRRSYRTLWKRLSSRIVSMDICDLFSI